MQDIFGQDARLPPVAALAHRTATQPAFPAQIGAGMAPNDGEIRAECTARRDGALDGYAAARHDLISSGRDAARAGRIPA